MEGVLERLNDAQRAAVTSTSQVLQVLAPPGSGKTKTLTARVGHLIANNGILPRNIIVCTFTVKAAREMQERISGFLGQDVASKLILGTFHSISRRFLASHGKKIDLDEKFSISDTSDTLAILTRIIKKRNFTMNSRNARSRISSLKSQGISAERYSLSSKGADQQEIAMIYSEYEDHLDLSKLLDFDDLLLRCAELLRRFPSCVSNIEAVLIDEFQDTNNVQYNLMSLFAQHKQNITVVGDPDQSIYGWRNAEIKNLKKMQQQYPDIHVAKLEENYRSSGAILLSAQEIIEQDEARPVKRLMPTHSVGMRPVLRQLLNAGAQGAWILSEIKRTVALTGGLLGFNDYAVLLRSAKLSRHVETALGKAGIPYRMVGGHKFFDRVEVKMILDYLRVISHPDHNDALARIVNVPSRKVGDVTINRLLSVASERKITLWKLVLGLAQGMTKIEPPISAQAQRGLGQFVGIILKARKKLEAPTDDEDSCFSTFVEWVLKKIEMEEHLRRVKPDEFDEHWSNVQELVGQATDFTKELQRTNTGVDLEDRLHDSAMEGAYVPVTMDEALSQFLANVALTTDAQKTDEGAGPIEQITLSTIHAAKGLEWPVVFIISVYDGSIPHSRAEDTDEERRLLYVAMTRAQCLLYLSYPLEDAGKSTKLSPFLSQKPMDSYFDKCGARFGFTVATELASILRRPRPEKAKVEHALATYDQIEDNRWPLNGRSQEEDESYGGKDSMSRYYSRTESSYGGSMAQGFSILTTMQQQQTNSISTTTLSTKFVTASTALATMKSAELKTTTSDITNQPVCRNSGTSLKRKIERAGSRHGQSSLVGFFGMASAKQSLLDQMEAEADRLPKRVQTERMVLKDITNVTTTEVINEEKGNDGRSEDVMPTVRPATTFHTTSISLLQQHQPAARKTLGIRRSMNGWSARMKDAPG